MDEFQFADAEAEPLDMGGMGGPAPQAAPDKKSKLRDYLKLAMLVPMAMKAGPGAMQGLLAGFQQGQQRQQQQGRQDATAQQTEAYRQQQLRGQQEQRTSLDAYRNQQLAQQQTQATQTRTAALLKQFSADLADVTDPAQVESVTQFYASQAGALGIDPAAFTAQAAALAPPTTIQRRQAEKRINTLKGNHGQDNWMKEGARFTSHKLGEEWVSFDEVLRRAGQDGRTASPADADVPNTDYSRFLARYAAGLKKPVSALTTADELEARKQFGRSDDAPRTPVDPAMAGLNRQIAEMRLENMRGAKDTNGLAPRIRTKVDAQAKGFDSQAVTKRTQTMAEAVSFSSGLDINTKNPADDQALIYAFAKGMDPDSVVREGEYATVQKYAQSWAEQFGFNVARIFSNTQFLTPQARANMKATIKAKYAAARQQYDNVRREYGTRINRMTGQTDGETYLIDYGAAFPNDGTRAEPVGGAGLAKPSAGNPYGGSR